ncbi:sigma-70 family RNA polymerase sigma factor [Arthrobacter tecti]
MLGTMSEEGAARVLSQTAGFDAQKAFAEHARAIYGFVYNTTRDASVAEDCVQETFVRAWRSRGRYSSERGSERSWLFAIARNVVVDELKARARRPTPITGDRMESETAALIEAGEVDDRIVLYGGLAQLSPEHRAVIVAVQLNGMSYQQLSERSGISVATLRTRMFYGLKALREVLREEDK